MNRRLLQILLRRLVCLLFAGVAMRAYAQEPEAAPVEAAEPAGLMGGWWNQELFEFRGGVFTTGVLIEAAVLFVLVFVAVFALQLVLRFVRSRNLYKVDTAGEYFLDEALAAPVQRTSMFLVGIVALYAGTRPLPLDPGIHRFLAGAAVVAGFFQAGLWIGATFSKGIQRYIDRRRETDPSSIAAFSIITFLGKVAIWAIILLLALQNLGFEITSLIAGLGIGGVAIAFALQNILGDIFCSVAILLDKPFEVGDFIIVGDQMGTVENIGVKTTRLRSLGGEQIVFSNQDLLNSRVRNYKRMYERRVVFGLGATYDTPPDKMEHACARIREIIESIDDTRFDRAHFKGFGDFALNIEVVYYVLKPDYNLYMDTQQEINVRIYRMFEELGIEFAYPTQTLFVQRTEGEAAENPAQAS